jgi:hypothetical protein
VLKGSLERYASGSAIGIRTTANRELHQVGWSGIVANHCPVPLVYTICNTQELKGCRRRCPMHKLILAWAWQAPGCCTTGPNNNDVSLLAAQYYTSRFSSCSMGP